VATSQELYLNQELMTLHKEYTCKMKGIINSNLFQMAKAFFREEKSGI
jgi:hypothetical protein